jgi:hypothetical protein
VLRDQFAKLDIAGVRLKGGAATAQDIVGTRSTTSRRCCCCCCRSNDDIPTMIIIAILLATESLAWDGK